ncbi:MAG TPA: 2-phosphosulfolactate phosphatase [Methylomirabilota bacterium]
MHVDVAPTAEALHTARIQARTVLVVDVLRASTTMIAALANGCTGVVPAPDAETARRLARGLPPGTYLLAGERRGEPIPGFDLGNSPLEFVAERVAGMTIVLSTSNGTRALLAARGGAAIGVAGLVNLRAAAGWAVAGGRDVTVACAGERGEVSLEDLVAAGLLVERMARAEPRAAPTAEAREALRAAAGYGGDVARLAETSTWARHLSRRGRAPDVAACLLLDTTTLVPEYRPEIDKVVRGPR